MDDKINVSIVSLGCDKNRVDTENMLYTLSNNGLCITNEYDKADVIIINTCAFIESARAEAIETILEMAEYKNTGNCKKLVVTGCLPQKYANDIKDDLQEVDAFLGIKDYDNIAIVVNNLIQKDIRVINTGCNDKENNTKRILTTPYHYAYLRIADGCNNKCTYCTIPSIRGEYKSRDYNSLLTEVSGIIKNGAKEIILVAQDVTKYGIDNYKKHRLLELVRDITKLEGLYKLRLMYCYPEQITKELIDEVDSNDKIAKYIDIPFQHTDDKILKLMHRKCSTEMLENIMQLIRASKNHIAIRTTFMVGFPGEGEQEFDNMYNFIAKHKPDHIGVFAYSAEEDTPSAKMPNHLDDKTKLERVDKIGKLHLQNCINRNKSMIGKVVKVIYEDIDYNRDRFKGRTEYDSPDIDTTIYFSGEFADVGQVYDVKITGYEDYDLIGEII